MGVFRRRYRVGQIQPTLYPCRAAQTQPTLHPPLSTHRPILHRATTHLACSPIYTPVLSLQNNKQPSANKPPKQSPSALHLPCTYPTPLQGKSDSSYPAPTLHHCRVSQTQPTLHLPYTTTLYHYRVSHTQPTLHRYPAPTLHRRASSPGAAPTRRTSPSSLPPQKHGRPSAC